MISDFLLVIIIALMTALVVYPSSQALWQTWETRKKGQARRNDPVRRH